MKLWQPTPAALWQGRDDSAEAANALRLFQTIVRAERFEPEMLAGDIALLGFTCDEGVRRNKGRTGAERGRKPCAGRWPIWPAMTDMTAAWIWGLSMWRTTRWRQRSRRCAKR